jgi:flagellar protein FliS
MASIGHNAYRTNAIETASPEQLTLMCYDGALRFLRRAGMALEDGDRATASSATGRAQAIINELNITLDMDAGGEIASNLRSLYLFLNRHLAEGIADGTPKNLTEAMAIITDLRDSWAQAMNLGAAAA